VDRNRSTVLLGDLNAHPDHPEMLLMVGSGLTDTFIASGETGDGFTARSNDPWERIDYIWATADLKARNFTVSQSLASDHFAVSVTLHKPAATALTR
jgi:endonuclease/exonuclease/phosphatase family metal-dependent hydrolase